MPAVTVIAGIEIPSTSPVFLTLVGFHILVGLACVVTGAGAMFIVSQHQGADYAIANVAVEVALRSGCEFICQAHAPGGGFVGRPPPRGVWLAADADHMKLVSGYPFSILHRELGEWRQRYSPWIWFLRWSHPVESADVYRRRRVRWPLLRWPILLSIEPPLLLCIDVPPFYVELAAQIYRRQKSSLAATAGQVDCRAGSPSGYAGRVPIAAALAPWALRFSTSCASASALQCGRGGRPAQKPAVSRCNRYPPRGRGYFAAANETTLPAGIDAAPQNFAQASISFRRFSNKSPRL